ncbi:MAG TPA: sugar phosphate isomerase/epimerase family protein [Candidatus Acidoferrum sp.]|nr:sugar phosphate isomerase/epimerase family protein [Candidatus Acidoferrum sp.]
MQLGIFAKTFSRAHFRQALDAVASHGLRVVHFNFNCVGLPTLPDKVEPAVTANIRADCAARDISITGVSGTFNMINPDAQALRNHLTRLPTLAVATREIGCDLITLCTGTRDPEDMWRAHPENSSPQAWRDLLRSMGEAIVIAEQHDIVLGVEPETGNVVSSVRKARQLLDELQSRRVKIVLDPANLFHHGDVGRVRDRIEEAFQLLGTDIVMAHAKELAPDGSVGTVPPGRGILDWNYYLDTLARMNFSGAIVMHGLSEAEVPAATRFLRSKLPD